MSNLSKYYQTTYPVPLFTVKDPKYKVLRRRPSALMIYGLMILRSNRGGDFRTYETDKEIMLFTGYSLTTVKKQVKLLKELGLIETRKRGRGRTIYMTTFELDEEKAAMRPYKNVSL